MTALLFLRKGASLPDHGEILGMASLSSLVWKLGFLEFQGRLSFSVRFLAFTIIGT